MSIFDGLFDRIAAKLGKAVQGYQPSQRYRDFARKGSSYSVESEISETLANLTLMMSTMPVSGDTERAKWLDDISDEFYRTKVVKALIAAFLSGDCIIVPAWNGRNIQNVIVSSEDFEILETVGDEMTSCAYVVDRMTNGTSEYVLFQSLTLEPYTANDGSKQFANHYRMYVSANGNGITNDFEKFPAWRDAYDTDWIIPNVDRLLVGRFKSNTVNPLDFNSVKGAPICFGASEPIEEIHYLLNAMHEEFGASEKIIMADKRLFKKEWHGDSRQVVLPRGKERLFMDVTGQNSEVPIHDWSPEIRYNAYLDNIDKQEQLVERAVGVSKGILSNPDDINYQNVDNVRKSQQKTISFVDNTRAMIEHAMTDLVYTWNVLANFYDINPMGGYSVSFDWSDDYIETFSDRQNAILAGEAIGATDAVDYRMFVFDESPETARDRVAEIQAAKNASNVDLLTVAAV